MSTTKRILVLVHEKTSEKDRNWDFFRDSLTAAMDDSLYEATMGALCDFTYVLSDDGQDIYDRSRGFALDDFDLVVFRIIRQEYARAGSCALLLQKKSIPYVDTAIQPRHNSKYAAAAIRQTEGFNTIMTVYARGSELAYMAEEDMLPMPYPVIVKDVNGRKGQSNFVAEDAAQVTEIVTTNPEIQFILQEFIPNDGDYRFLVLGSKIQMVIHRKAAEGSHLNNTSQGAASQIVELDQFSEEVKADVIKAARLENLEVAGVDIMFDLTTGKHYVVEVNSSPQLASGAAPERKMAAYANYLKSLIAG